MISLDSYYRDQAEKNLAARLAVNYDHPDSLEFPLLLSHLRLLRSGKTCAVPRYDFAQHTRSPDTDVVAPHRVIVVEGILVLHHPELRNEFDLKVFVEAPPEVRFSRRCARDVAERGRTATSVREQWETTVQRMYEEYCAPSIEYADMRIDGCADLQAMAILVRSAIERLAPTMPVR